MFQKKKRSIAFSSERFRFTFLGVCFVGLFVLVLWKLFYLQVIHGQELHEQAQEMRNASISISARRGGIFVQDTKTNEVAPVALNTTLYTVFFDAHTPTFKYNSTGEDFEEVASFLTETLYTSERFLECQENLKKCPKGSVKQVVIPREQSDEDTENDNDLVENREASPQVIESAPSLLEAKRVFQKNITDAFLKKRTRIIWATEVEKSILTDIESQSIPSLYVSFEKKQVYIDLEGLTDSTRNRISSVLAKQFGGDVKSISAKLYPKRKGYIPVMQRVYPHEIEIITEKQKEAEQQYFVELKKYNALKKANVETSPPPPPSFLFIGFEKDPLRYYPEGDFASQVIGFVNADKQGQYGIERSLNRILKGEDGLLSTSRNVSGASIDIDEKDTHSVQDGANVILTIDRTLQKSIELLLDEKVEEFKADSAQAIVLDPQTGKILVMAGSPRFDPNFFGRVYERKQVEEEDIERIYKTTPLEQKDEDGVFIPADFDIWEQSKNRGAFQDYYMFQNTVGPRAYVNKSIMEIYEPGSVIKPLAVATALEEGEVSPYARFHENGPLEVGKFTIRNADGQYLRSQSVSNILERSANVGMALIVDKLGPALMYESLKNLRFGEYTNILLPEELSGEVHYYKKWSDARLYTSSYGQGFSATPLQVVRAWTPLAHSGYLVEPRIVERVEYPDGTVEEIETKKYRVFSHKTIDQLSKMLVSSVETGVAKHAKLRNYYVAGKTGTSQIIGLDGKYESIEDGSVGTTITSFIGFAPVENPKYLVFVKFDRPRKAVRNLSVFGSTTAGPTFAEIMLKIFEYYNVSPDK